MLGIEICVMCILCSPVMYSPVLLDFVCVFCAVMWEIIVAESCSQYVYVCVLWDMSCY